jgi:tRNA modification GTPase
LDTAEPTIFALASGLGRAGVAVMRISGERAEAILAALAGKVPAPRHASLRRLRDPAGEMLDHALVLWFPAPASYTGEDCVELHLHGGPAVLDGVTGALLALGARPAEPGEFTRRAFLNGKMDLTEAEAVLDLITAETAAQRGQALRQLGGGLTRTYEAWRTRLMRLLAHQEALIDFPDEDLPPEVEEELRRGIDTLRGEMAAHLDDERRGERLREGVIIAVTGPPNAGKSSLVNALTGRDIAIVSAQPGTTRDAIEARLVLGGVPVTLVDTAGLRETNDPIEAEGVRRARARAREADIVLRLQQAGTPLQDSKDIASGDIAVATKIDLLSDSTITAQSLAVSVVTGAGMDALRSRLSAEVTRLTQGGAQTPLTRARHRAALSEALERLNAAQDAPTELCAEDLRLALRSLGRVTGRVGVEEILGLVFSQFCIGK